MADEKRGRKKRGILLATGGLLLALGVILALRLLGVARAGYPELAAGVAATLAVQAVLWVVAHRGWDAKLRWDPHFVHLPTLAAAFLLAFYGYLAPSARVLLLMAWFVALLFMAGLGGLGPVVALSSLMAVLHIGVGVLLLWEGRLPVSLPFEGIVTGVFFAICVYAGLVFDRLRRHREEMVGLRRQLARLALRDPLTDLPNRRHFEEKLREELARARRYGSAPSVAIIDVDHFKRYNDSLGHPAGDEVLRQLGRLLERSVRESDVAARYGGEEFALLLVETPIEEAWEVVERLRAAVEAHDFPDESVQPEGRLTVSAGIAAGGRDPVDEEELIARADRALYSAKSAGRNRVHLAA